jgi:hypothetical protein
MKSSKKKSILFIILTFLTLLSLALLFFIRRQPSFNPISDKNDFYNQLNLAIKTSHLETSSLIVRDFLHQVEFTVKNDNDTFYKVIISDQKNPLTQIASLQELIKTAKMKEKSLKSVDLSAIHPYATFKNN